MSQPHHEQIVQGAKAYLFRASNRDPIRLCTNKSPPRKFPFRAGSVCHLPLLPLLESQRGAPVLCSRLVAELPVSSRLLNVKKSLSSEKPSRTLKPSAADVTMDHVTCQVLME